MKYLLLDVKNREVKTVEANGLDDYYELIGCRNIDIDGTPMLFGNLLVASGRVTEDGELTELTELTQEEIDEIMDNIATITTSVYKEPYPVFVEMDY